MKRSIQVTKTVNTDVIDKIIPLPDYKGKTVTVIVLSDESTEHTDKEEMREALNRLESSCKASSRSLESFREERLSKYEVVN